MTDVAITQLPAAPLNVFEIWSNPLAVLDRFEKAFGPSLPPLRSSLQLPDRLLTRCEPTVWLVEGETTGLTELLGSDGSITAIGGGLVRVRLTGAGWRSHAGRRVGTGWVFLRRWRGRHNCSCCR